MQPSTLELMALTAAAAFAGGAAIAMDHPALASVFAAITLWAVIIGVVLSPAE